MKIEIDDKIKHVYVWLTKEESKDSLVMEEIKPMLDEYKDNKYKLIVFHSGEGDLIELTKGLLSHNKNLALNNTV
ncbi:MAG: hypothetical protein E7259_10735 [Lachnospiraceae bacterium]|nr:hypothetical protein [Lachnospiraceae bacterium]